MGNVGLRILVIGAHPDDCEVKCAGTSAKWVRRGHVVRFVSATDGQTGHHEQAGAALAQRRIAEAKAAAGVIGVESLVLPIPNGQIEANLIYRSMFIHLLREFEPDFVITHRPNDYPPDHRYTSQLVQDAAYIMTVPNNVAAVPALRRNPVIAYMADDFRKPYPFQADAAVAIDDVIDLKIGALHCHVSQMYEWVPWHEGKLDQVPADDAGRRKWLFDARTPPDAQRADRNRDKLVERYGREKGGSIRFAEVFEFCEYGSQPDDAMLERLFGGL